MTDPKKSMLEPFTVPWNGASWVSTARRVLDDGKQKSPDPLCSVEVGQRLLLPPSPSAEKFHLCREVLSYKKFSEGWDGYDGHPPFEQTVDDAVKFIDRIPESYNQSCIPLPKSSLGGDGELVLYWRFKGSYAEASFTGDGRFSFYSAINRKKVYCPGDQRISESLNNEMEKIASVLAHLVSESHELS